MEAHRLRRSPPRPPVVAAIVAAAMLAGCAAPRPAGALLVRHGQFPHHPAPNLLGDNADLVAAARDFTYRSDWPSVPVGFFVDDVTHYSTVIYDDQTFFDELGGIHEHVASQVRSGLLVRD